MAGAFALTLSYLAEHASAAQSAGAFAAYITGNVASNLFGRFSAALVDYVGLAGNFFVFAALNLAGAALVYASLVRSAPATMPAKFAWTEHPRTRACAQLSPSGSSSCSPSSARSPT